MNNLQSVNRSTPQLVHAPSKQSVTASDDYYSLKSDGSSNDEGTAILLSQFQTPPSHTQSPRTSKERIQPDAVVPTIRQVIHQNPSPGLMRRPLEVHFKETQTIKRKPAVPGDVIAQRAADPELSPPTPGIDDTPYIRFAIDQLTRDEELLGARRPETSSKESYPVHISVPANSKGPQEQKGFSTRQERQSSETVIRHPNVSFPRNIFLPIESSDGHRYPGLDFIPAPLRVWSLGSLLLCCLLMIVLIVFCNIWSLRHDGLLHYDGASTGRYFLFEFLPQILASVIVVWLLVIQVAIVRTFPFTTLASAQNNQNSRILHTAALFPNSFLIPDLSFFQHGEPLLGACFIVFWLVMFTVPLQSCLFQTRYYTLGAQQVWRWTSVQGVGWTLFAIYILLYSALAIVLLRFWRRQTGLKWDATCLADIFTLVHRSNILSDFEASELRRNTSENQMPKKYRLGYWRTSNQPSENFHSIGESNAPVNRYSVEQAKMKAKTSREKDTDYAKYDVESQRAFRSPTLDSLQKDIHSSVIQRQWVPWFLKDTFVVAWIVIVIVLMIAFLVVSFVNRAAEKGFLPHLPAPTTAEGFSPANFLYSFLPSLIGMILFLLWQPIDLYFRALQPFANLCQPGGATAENSLLLDYTASPPLKVTLNALMARHWKVAHISFISLLSITLPILGGGVFTAQYFPLDDQVRTAASMPAYIALVFFVVVYALSFLVVWPGRKRHLPHNIRTLGQLISFVYQSSLLHDAALKDPQTKIDLVTRLLSGEKDGGVRYGLGVYSGMDGREHFGIDKLKREGVGEMLITTGK